jgi:hypothetical protein
MRKDEKRSFCIMLLVGTILVEAAIVSTSWLLSNNNKGFSVKSNIFNNAYYYISSKERNKILPSNTMNNIHASEFGKGIKIAVIVPTFTSAAYHTSFYLFYKKYAYIPTGVNVTTNLNLLSSKVKDIGQSASSSSLPSSLSRRSAFAMLQLLNNLKWITRESNITVLTDADVDAGLIFAKNNIKNNEYNIVILGHQEYVTQTEYNNLKQFVANGGTMVIRDGNVFFAEVKYNRLDQIMTLVRGHWWAFNGKSAWKSIGERWASETSRWVGSNYLCYRCIGKFANNPFGYRAHEEQYITNPNDIILLNYNASLLSSYNNYHALSLSYKRPVIASYELNYGKGRVISLGIYSDDIVTNGTFLKYFDSLLSKYYGD